MRNVSDSHLEKTAVKKGIKKDPKFVYLFVFLIIRIFTLFINNVKIKQVQYFHESILII